MKINLSSTTACHLRMICVPVKNVDDRRCSFRNLVSMQSCIRIFTDLPLQQSNCHALNVSELSSIILTPTVYCKQQCNVKKVNLFKNIAMWYKIFELCCSSSRSQDYYLFMYGRYLKIANWIKEMQLFVSFHWFQFPVMALVISLIWFLDSSCCKIPCKERQMC